TITLDSIAAPGTFSASYVTPTFDDSVELTAITLPPSITIPDAPEPLDISGLFNGSMPSFNISDANLQAPSLSTPTLPSAPSVNVPSFQSTSSNLSAPDITVPAFDVHFN